jgi:UDP-N-acetylglucosamine transferase subunit ALG13
MIPGTHRLVQHERLRRRGWSYAGSVFDGFRVRPIESCRESTGLRILVTVGTIKPYKFDRLLHRIEQIALPGDEVIWQTGSTEYRPRIGQVSTDMVRNVLLRQAEQSDVVVCHAGVGSILAALRVGKIPVVVPRRQDHDEHVDNHQFEIAQFVEKLNLGVHVDADRLTRDHLLAAANLRCLPA